MSTWPLGATPHAGGDGSRSSRGRATSPFEQLRKETTTDHGLRWATKSGGSMSATYTHATALRSVTVSSSVM